MYPAKKLHQKELKMVFLHQMVLKSTKKRLQVDQKGLKMDLKGLMALFLDKQLPVFWPNKLRKWGVVSPFAKKVCKVVFES